MKSRSIKVPSSDHDDDDGKLNLHDGSSSDLEQDNVNHFYCNRNFHDVPNEEWVKCSGKCKRWCHENCTRCEANIRIYILSVAY